MFAVMETPANKNVLLKTMAYSLANQHALFYTVYISADFVEIKICLNEILSKK
jgi:hypothetical protein